MFTRDNVRELGPTRVKPVTSTSPSITSLPMPPKARLRVPITPPLAPKSASRAAVSGQLGKPRRPPLRPQTVPISSPQSPWYQRRNTQNFARYVAWTTHGVLILCGMLWVRDHYVDFQHVRGASMAPTLNPTVHETGEEDSVIMRPYKMAGGRRKGTDNDVRRGDVITFWKPHRPEEISIKRIVAVEGDTVYPQRGYAIEPNTCRDRLLGLPDGLPDPDVDAITAPKDERGKVVVPYGHVWIEGDNWRCSLDSNDFGPISKGLILGKAIWVWRTWFRFEEVGDGRIKKESKERSRVIPGRSEIPAIFLE